MINTFRSELYKDIFEQYNESNRIGMCNLILSKHEIQHYSLKKNNSIDAEHYIVKDKNVRNMCNEIINNNSCDHESLINILDKLSEDQLSIIGF